MRPARMRTLALIGAGSLALTMMGAGGAGASQGDGDGPGQDQAVQRHAAATTKAEQAAVRAYWTPERMRNAVPRELVGPQVTKGKPGGDSSSAQAVEVPPVPALGKVFFTLGGTNYVCSGTATQSSNRDVVTTAGHCLNEGPGDYATNFAFVPAYDDGARPFGTWVAESLMAPTAWVNNGDFNHDVGFAVMAEQAGASLADAVGSYPIAFNKGYGLRFDAFGYPAARPYDGSDLWRCSGTAGMDTRGTTDHRLPCSMTGGSSGGGWITSDGQLNSVNSFGYRGEKDVMYGPYFGDVEQAVYATAQNS